jgi:archaellum component FlaC
MHYRIVAIIGTLAVTLVAGACSREAAEVRNESDNVSREAARAAELARQRDDEIARLDERVASIEREYSEAKAKVASGSRTATAGLREELQEDVTNLRQAINNLKDTTPQNWWDRHEAAMRQTADDIEADVRRLAGAALPRRPAETAGTTGDGVSTAPFTSRRDQFVTALRARVDAMEDALDKVKARDARETELEDTQARVKKLAEDVERLGSASADDWWDVTKARVNDYVDRVENSVERLDDDKK